MKYVAVGFKINQDRSIFYFKTNIFEVFISKLRDAIEREKPDFVSLRMVKEK